MTTGPYPTWSPETRRHRFEPVRRDLTARRVERLTPGMIRIVCAGEALAGFESASPDDHIKLLLPFEGEGRPPMRDYTPRRYDPASGELAIDVFDHEGGPVAAWARGLKPGDRVAIAGPRGSQVVAGDIRSWLLVGDETALPAIGRRVEETPAGHAVTTLVSLADPADRQVFESAAEVTSIWSIRRAEDLAADLIEDAARIAPPPATFVWIAAEAAVARALRAHFVARGVPLPWIKAAGYWSRGLADAPDKILDES